MSTDSLFEQYGPAYKWLATGTAMLGTLSMTLATTIVNVAIPDIMGNFGMTQTKAQWLSTGFLAPMAAFMLVSAWTLQRFGMKSAYIGAVSVFMVASVLGGMSQSENMIIFSRMLQGAMAGIVQPLAMTVIFTVFPERQRGIGMGIYGIGVILGPAIGPAIGGVLVDWLSWRAVFFMPLPACLLAIIFALFFAPGKDDENASNDFDWFGFALLCLFIGCLLSATSNGQRIGWDSLEIVSLFVVALASFSGFIIWELVSPRPLLNIRIFGVPGFAAGSAIAFCFGFGLFGSTYLIPIFVQDIQGFTATTAGLLLMPAGIIMAAAFPVAGYLTDRVSAPGIIAAGMLLLAVSCWALGWADVSTLPWVIMFWIAVGRLGFGFGLPAISTGSLRTLNIALVSQGSGANSFARQLGGALGVNLLSLGLDVRTTHHARAFTDAQTVNNPLALELLSKIQAMGPSTGLSPDQLVPVSHQFLRQMIEFQAYTRGFQDSFLMLSFVFIFTLVPVVVMYFAKQPAHSYTLVVR